ncbi:MAG: site-2 protease family protein [Actinomycetota bacterium]
MLTGHRWKIATVRGIPLYVSTSWVWIAALYIWSQYNNLTIYHGVRAGSAEAVLLAVLAAALFFASILAHETAHAVMARGLGLPVRGVTLVFWGGATETRADIRGPLGEFLVAFVGPATTLALSGVFWVAHIATQGVISEIVGYLSWLSLIFAVLNALPGFPLDGGRMLLAAVWGLTKNRRTALRAAGWSGVPIGLVFGTAAVWFIANGGVGMGIFAGYIAAILISTGRGMEQRIAFRDQLMKGRVADAMRPPPPTIPATMSLAEALDHALRGTQDERFPVVGETGHVIGSVSMESARRVGARDPLRPVRDAVIPLNQTTVLDPDETLDGAFEWLGGERGLVVRDGVLVGALTPRDVEHWYRRVIEGHSAPTRFAALPPRPDL